MRGFATREVPRTARRLFDKRAYLITHTKFETSLNTFYITHTKKMDHTHRRKARCEGSQLATCHYCVYIILIHHSCSYTIEKKRKDYLARCLFPLPTTGNKARCEGYASETYLKGNIFQPCIRHKRGLLLYYR